MEEERANRAESGAHPLGMESLPSVQGLGGGEPGKQQEKPSQSRCVLESLQVSRRLASKKLYTGEARLSV